MQTGNYGACSHCDVCHHAPKRKGSLYLDPSEDVYTEEKVVCGVVDEVIQQKAAQALDVIDAVRLEAL